MMRITISITNAELRRSYQAPLGTIIRNAVSLIIAALFIPTVLGSGVPEPSLIFYGTIRNAAEINARVTSGTLTWQIRQPDTHRTVTLTTTLSNALGQFSCVLVVPCETRINGPVSDSALELPFLPQSFDRSLVSVDGKMEWLSSLPKE